MGSAGVNEIEFWFGGQVVVV